MSNEKVRSGALGSSLPEASTEDAEKLQALMPNKPKEEDEKTTFEGAGTFFMQNKDGKKSEVRFLKVKNHRFSTSDKVIIEQLNKKGFNIITKEQLQAEREQRIKDNRNNKATNASMNAYVDMRLGEFKEEVGEMLKLVAKNGDSTTFKTEISTLKGRITKLENISKGK